MGAIRLFLGVFLISTILFAQNAQFKRIKISLEKENFYLSDGKISNAEEKLILEDISEKSVLISDALMIPISDPEPFIAISVRIFFNGSIDQIDNVYVRTSEDGKNYGEWRELEKFDLHPLEEGEYATDVAMFPPNSKFYQIKINLTKASRSKFEIRELSASFISPGKTPQEEVERYIRESNQKIYELKKDKDGKLTQAYPRPNYVPRSSWGASLGLTNTNSSRVTTTVTHLVLHHSSSDTYANDYAAVVRTYYLSHINDRGWSDIGYNWLVDPNGVLYQGRAWKSSTEENVIGAHNSNYNSNCLGLNIIGNYEVYQPTQKSLDKMADIMAFLCDKFDLNPLATTYFAPLGVNKPVITGHKHSGGGTDCPGVNLISKYDWFRNTVKSLLEGGAGTVTLQSPANDSRMITIKPTLSWNALSGATKYELQVSKKSDFSSDIVINENNLTATSYQPQNNLEYGVKYYWRVKADNTQSWSEVRNFTTDPMQPLWERSSRSQNKPSWFGTNTERGIAYTNGKLFIVSRAEGTKVKVLNALTGEDEGELNVTGVLPGTPSNPVSFALNDIESSWDGKLLACNLTNNANKVPFRIYKWDNETAAPSLFIEFATSDSIRLGDMFTLYGSLSSNAAIYAAAPNSNRVYRWIIANGSLASQTPTLITLSNFTLGTTPSVAPYGYDANSDFYVNSLGKEVTLFSSTGQNKGSISGSVIPSGSSSITTFVKSSKRFIATFQWNNTPDDPNGQNLRLVDVTAGAANVTANDVYGITPRLGNDNNANGTGDFAYWADNNGNYVIFVLATNSGIGAYWCKEDPLYSGGSLTNFEEKKSVNAVVSDYSLEQNYPNPFNPTTRITFSLPSTEFISLEVYDLLGQKVATLATGVYSSGTHSVSFDAKGLNSGIYIYTLNTRSKTLAKKMILMK